MKKLILTFIILLFISTVFTGCNKTSKNDKKILHDFTVSVKNEFPGPSNKNKIMQVDSIADSKYTNELKEIFGDSEAIVRGTVKKVTYTNFKEMAWTKADILITDSFKGSLQNGDLVSVFLLGGYVTLQDHIKYADDKFRFAKLTDDEINNTVLKEVNNGMPFLEVGDDFFYCLVTTPDFSSLPKDAYESISALGQLFIDKNGNFIHNYYEEGKKTSYNYTLDEIKSKIK